MRLLALILSTSVLAGAGAGAASAVTAAPPASPSTPLTAVQVVDHAPLSWHFEHRGGRLVVAP